MIRACVFDAYGTLFDVAAAARDAGVPHWPRIAADWRRKQLEYTWLRAITGDHADFWQVTQDALDWALDGAGLADPDLADPDLRARLLALYHRLAAFPEVPGVLAELALQGRRLAILSNGTPGMLAGAVGAAGLDGMFEAVLSVESVGVFKPHRRVYDLVPARLGLPPAEVLFVSSNGWDACGGAAYGFATAWINREGAPPDRLPGHPRHVLRDLSALPKLLATLNL